MSKQHYSFNDTDCADCADLIMKDDEIYFSDDGKLCRRCAERDHLICSGCGGQKKPQFNQCWECGQSGKEPNHNGSVAPAKKKRKMVIR